MGRTLATARVRITSSGMAELTDRAVFSLTGPEARPFLQGLITNDVDKLAPEQPLYAALLTPQGKVLFDFLIFERDGALLFDCRRTVRDALVKRLSLYKLRAKVELASRDDLGVFRDDGGVADPRLPELGGRLIAPRSGAPSGTDAYQAQRLALGVPEGDDFGSDRMFALDADLDELHGVSFDKGCYVGQELTARMKHRGKDRKRLLPITHADGGDLPGAGMAVMAGAHEIATITSTYGARGFALTRLDRLSEAGDAPLDAGGASVRITKPHWLFT